MCLFLISLTCCLWVPRGRGPPLLAGVAIHELLHTDQRMEEVENTTPTLGSSCSCCCQGAAHVRSLHFWFAACKSAGVFLGKFWVTDVPCLLRAVKSQGLHKQQHMTRYGWSRCLLPQSVLQEISARCQRYCKAWALLHERIRESQNYLGWEGI